MQAYMVLAENAEQKRLLETFLKASNINFVPTKPTLAELEARLTPQQLETWMGLKNGLEWVQKYKNGTISKEETTSLDDFLNRYEAEKATI